MPYTFVKLSSEITKSTIWAEDDATFRIWIWLLASADRNGIVRATVPGIAIQCVKTNEQVERALAKFEAPDAYSSNPANEGRRLERIQGGFRLLNYAAHRDRKAGDPDWQAERHRKNQAAYRDRKRSGDRGGDRKSGHGDRGVTTYADTDTEAEVKCGGKPNSPVETNSGGSTGSSAEPRKGPRSAPEPKQERKLAGTVPLNTGDDYPIYADDLEQWQKTYPAVDVRQELKEFKQWSIDNPTRRKTKAGIRRAINTWLSKEQDRGGTNGNGNHHSGARQSVLGDNKRELAKTLQRIGERGGHGSTPDPAGNVLRAALPERSADAVPGVSGGPDGGAGDHGTEPGNGRRVEILPPAGTAAGTGGRRNREWLF